MLSIDHPARSLLAPIGGVLCILLVACGGAGRTDRMQAGPSQPEGQVALDGAGVNLDLFTTLEVETQWETAAVAAPGAVVVVEGAAQLDHGLGPVLHVGRSGKSSLERFPLPLEQPLFNVSAFWSGSEVVIVGLSCPSWSDKARLPEVAEDAFNTFSSECGEDRYVAMGWDLESGRFRVVSESIFETGSGVFLQDSSQSLALFALGGGGFVALRD